MSCFSVIVKLTYACPLRCNYCYNGDASISDTVIDVEKVKKLIARTTAYARRMNFAVLEYIWMGGEPLLLPTEVFDEIVRSQNQSGAGMEIHNFLQTSGVFPNSRDNIVEHLASLGFRFSVSLDGPKEIHDQHRLGKKGAGTHTDAFRTYKLIQRTGAPVGAIAVLTRAACSDIDRFYDFFAGHNIHFSFLAPYRAGFAVANGATVPTPAELSTALIRLFDRWFNGDSDYVYCSTLSSMLSSLIYGTPKGCSGSRNCSLRTLSVDPDGDCYPCPSFPRDDRYIYGNLFSHDLESLLTSENALHMLSRNSGDVATCTACEYREICNAGCPRSALSTNGTIHSADGNCASYFALYSHMKSRLSEAVSISKRTAPHGMQIEIAPANRVNTPAWAAM